MRDLVFYSLEAWDDVWRRNQFFADLLVRRNADLRILFVAPSAVLGKRHTRLKGVAGPLSAPTPLAGYDRIFLAQPIQLPMDGRGIVRRVNDTLQRWALAIWTRRLGMNRPLLWLNDHRRVHLARRSIGPVIYDITDDWIEALPPSPMRDQVEADDAELCRLADATIVCSARLAESKRSLVPAPPRLHVVANGVHFNHYAAVRDRTGAAAHETAAWERPVFGYTGTLHDERIDVPLVEALANRLEHGSIAFVGPNHLSPESKQRLANTGRIHFVSAVPYANIPQYMRAMDVMIVPHKVSAFVESLNPIKLWEYLAAALPIVATPVAGFREFPQVVLLAGGAEAFAAVMQQALNESPLLAGERARLAKDHSWDSRVAQVEKILNGVCSAKWSYAAEPAGRVAAGASS